MRSGSGAMSFKPYSYAKDLEFLRPILEMRSTDTCWEDEPAEEESSVQTQEPTNPQSPNQEIAEIPGEEEQEEGAAAPLRTTKRGGATKRQIQKESDKMYSLLKDLSDCFTGQLTLSQQFANTLVPYFDQVPDAMKMDMQISVMQTTKSYIPSPQNIYHTDRSLPMQPTQTTNYASWQNPPLSYQMPRHQTYRAENPYESRQTLRRLDHHQPPLPPPSALGPPGSGFGAPDVGNRGPPYHFQNVPSVAQEQQYVESAPCLSSQQPESCQDPFNYHTL